MNEKCWNSYRLEFYSSITRWKPHWHVVYSSRSYTEIHPTTTKYTENCHQFYITKQKWKIEDSIHISDICRRYWTGNKYFFQIFNTLFDMWLSVKYTLDKYLKLKRILTMNEYSMKLERKGMMSKKCSFTVNYYNFVTFYRFALTLLLTIVFLVSLLFCLSLFQQAFQYFSRRYSVVTRGFYLVFTHFTN